MPCAAEHDLGTDFAEHGRLLTIDEGQVMDYFALDTNKMGWDILEVPEIDGKLPLKTCVVDEKTGVAVWKIKYPAGYTTISHWHNCSHGIYVLDGILRTHAGEYGPGSFVWFPEGLVQSHGATETDDVIFLFITNKPFDIHFTHLEGQPPQP